MATRVTAKGWEIQNGPSKLDLMLSLFDGSNAQRTRRSVQFTTVYIAAGVWYVEAVVDLVSREDGSGESWILDGYITRIGCPDFQPVSHVPFHAYYRTDRRHGNIEFTVEIPDHN